MFGLAYYWSNSCIIRFCHPISDFALGWTRSSLYHTEWKSWIVAKSICTNWNSASAHAAWVKHLTQAAWAEAEFQFVQRYFAAILDFHSVWYRDDLVKPRVKLEQLYFGLTGPNVLADFRVMFCYFCWALEWKLPTHYALKWALKGIILMYYLSLLIF